MHGVGALRGKAAPSWTAILLAALACAVLLTAALAESAAAAGLVGKDGKVYACYRTRGRAKGAVRLVTKRKHCRRGEKKISWNATGPAGESGQGGPNGESGANGEFGAGGLETRVEKLADRVESLEGKLKGITNATLSEVVAKLQGVSGAQLQEAVKSVADVNALCTQATKLTNQVDALGGVLEGVEVLGSLLFPSLPMSLPAFGCPP